MPEGPIPVAHCARCGREVLAVLVSGPFDDARACAHCEALLAPASLRWIGEEDLDAVGYAAYPGERDGCGRSGCGGGRCGRAS